jgi:hypothetical protein
LGEETSEFSNVAKTKISAAITAKETESRKFLGISSWPSELTDCGHANPKP